MKLSKEAQRARYGIDGVAFLAATRPILGKGGVEASVARALCNYFYRDLLAPEWIKKPLVAIKQLSTTCSPDHKLEFRRANQTAPFGPDNCVVVQLSRGGVE